MKLNRRWTATVLTAAALALTACSNDSTAPETVPAASSAAAAPVQSPEPTPTPTPTPISKEEAGAQYLELVAPPNALNPQWNDAINSADWESVRTIAQQYADANRAFADGLMAAEWPPEAQAAVDSLVAELAGEIGAFASISAATTDDDTIGALNTFPARGSSAQQLRMILGLENVSAG